MADGYTLIDKGDIASVIAESGTTVQVYLPSYTADFSGDPKVLYVGPAITETALIRPRTVTHVVNEQGLSFEADALGYFMSNSKVASEAEVRVTEGDELVTYYVISTQPSYFEGEQKFVKGVLQRRRTEPVIVTKM